MRVATLTQLTFSLMSLPVLPVKGLTHCSALMFLNMVHSGLLLHEVFLYVRVWPIPAAIKEKQYEI